MLFLETSTDAASAGASLVLSGFFGLIGLVFLGIYIYVLMDILKQPDSAWQMSGQNKSLWIGLWVAGLCCGFSIIIAIIYWFVIRPKLVTPQMR
jgi:hypothetical protein